jgi:hypothetical protein
MTSGCCSAGRRKVGISGSSPQTNPFRSRLIFIWSCGDLHKRLGASCVVFRMGTNRSHPSSSATESARASKLGLSSCGDSEEFRNSGRQFVHVGNDEHRTAGFQACPVFRPAMASCAKADCGHPGGKGGVDTCRAVLEG